MLASQTLIIWQVRTIHVVIVFSDLMVDNAHAPMTVCTYYVPICGEYCPFFTLGLKCTHTCTYTHMQAHTHTQANKHVHSVYEAPLAVVKSTILNP